MLTYARHLAAGRIAPTRVLAEVDYGNHTPEPADILRKMAEAGDAERGARKLQSAACRLPRAQGQARRAARADARAKPTTAFADGQLIGRAKRTRACRNCARGSALARQAPATSPTIKALYNAVRRRAAQHRHQADRRRSTSKHARRDQRTEGRPENRTHPRQHGALALAAARPRQNLRDGQHPGLHAQGRARSPAGLAHQDRVRQTADADAAVSATMDTVLVNPSWYVPQSIIQNELLPLYATIRTFSTAWAWK